MATLPRVLRFGDDTVIVDENGNVFDQPRRSQFDESVDGDIAFIRAVHEHNTRAAAMCGAAFADAFRKAIRS